MKSGIIHRGSNRFANSHAGRNWISAILARTGVRALRQCSAVHRRWNIRPAATRGSILFCGKTHRRTSARGILFQIAQAPAQSAGFRADTRLREQSSWKDGMARGNSACRNASCGRAWSDFAPQTRAEAAKVGGRADRRRPARTQARQVARLGRTEIELLEILIVHPSWRVGLRKSSRATKIRVRKDYLPDIHASTTRAHAGFRQRADGAGRPGSEEYLGGAG